MRRWREKASGGSEGERTRAAAKKSGPARSSTCTLASSWSVTDHGSFGPRAHFLRHLTAALGRRPSKLAIGRYSVLHLQTSGQDE